MRRPPKVGEEVFVRLRLYGVSRCERAVVVHVGWRIRVRLVDTYTLASCSEDVRWARGWDTRAARRLASAAALATS